jgi:2-polyprenyl-3-methyl-5-hydroxy-6-metoxy-1,4-benzoquinol methylase
VGFGAVRTVAFRSETDIAVYHETVNLGAIVLAPTMQAHQSMVEFADPQTGKRLRHAGDTLVSDDGTSYPIVQNIPRFVSPDNYAAAFGLEWKIHSRTQLDSHTGTTISRTRLERCLGQPVDAMRGVRVLEAGCGAGRFTELLVGSGAFVHSIDLSVAVEANRENIGDRANYTVGQADLRSPPFPPGAFDVVICLGVLQHTPSPEESIRSLWRMVTPGGLLVIDHYTWSLSLVTKLAPLYRLALLRMAPEKAKSVTDAMTRTFFPIHWRVRRVRLAQMLLSRVSPCLVYFDAFPELTYEQHLEFTRLDTFDHLTDYYKHLRTRGQIERILEELGATEIIASYGGNGVEARCRKPRNSSG